MKKLSLATFAVVALAAGSAGAADLPARPLPPLPPSCAQFGGFYVGGNAGWGTGEHKFRDLDGFASEVQNRFNILLPTEVSRTVDGFAYGVQGGYNWQFRCTLFGIEADYNWTDIDHDFVRTGPLGRATLAGSSSLQGFGTVRARSGVIVDNLLLYVTGGLAYANTEQSVALTVADFPQFNQGPFSDEKTRWGWTAGFGTEYSFAPNWSFKGEVLYARFETEEIGLTCTLLCDPNRQVRFEHESSAWVTRVGINYRFGGGWFGGGFGGGTY
jgi:outer membrane immunogenic protein